jgi:transcriptional regulator GlxA family with amidase domain
VQFSCFNTRRLNCLYIHFDLIGVPGVAVQRLFHRPLTLPANPRLLAVARQLTRQLLSQPVASPSVLCQTKALVYAALAQILPADALPAAIPPVSAALQHIEAHLGTLMTNAQLAGLCHFSEDHFVRLFRRHLDQTPAQYILERRIATATNQLAFTDDSIEQIAANLGFANRYHFTKMFSRRMRVSPAAYRKQTRV